MPIQLHIPAVDGAHHQYGWWVIWLPEGYQPGDAYPAPSRSDRFFELEQDAIDAIRLQRSSAVE